MVNEAGGQAAWGEFKIQVPPGTYTVTVELPGFERVRLLSFRVEENEATKLDPITLTLAPLPRQDQPQPSTFCSAPLWRSRALKLTPPANSYVVWFQQQDSPAQNQGELKIGNDLTGELKSTTTLNNFNVFVTGETDSQAKSPSNQLVLQATVQQ